MGMYTSVRNAVVSAWLWRVLRSMSRETILKVLDMVCTLNPGWRSNLAAAREFVEGEHPFYQWIMAMRRDLNPLAFHRFVRNAVFANFVADRRQADYEKERGAPPLSNVVISVTERCNLRCEGCWAAEYDKRDDLPYPLLDRIVRELKEMRASFVTFTGGEPFMRADILDLMEAHPDVFFQIYTNGTLITDAMADRLAKLGNAVPLVSINGFERDNDGIRGAGNFKAVSEAFDRLKSRGIFFGVSLTATSRNMNAMTDPAFYDWLIAKGAKLGVGLPVHPRGPHPEPRADDFPRAARRAGAIHLCAAQFAALLHCRLLERRRPCRRVHGGGKAVPAHHQPRGRGALRVLPLQRRQHPREVAARGDPLPVLHRHQERHPLRREPAAALHDGGQARASSAPTCRSTPRGPAMSGAESLVEGLADGLDERAGRVRQVMDRVWHGGDYASFFTFDPRWYNAIPPADARAAADTRRPARVTESPGGGLRSLCR